MIPRRTYFEAIITLIALPTEPSILPFISSRANAASDVLENLMYVTPERQTAISRDTPVYTKRETRR